MLTPSTNKDKRNLCFHYKGFVQIHTWNWLTASNLYLNPKCLSQKQLLYIHRLSAPLIRASNRPHGPNCNSHRHSCICLPRGGLRSFREHRSPTGRRDGWESFSWESDPMREGGWGKSFSVLSLLWYQGGGTTDVCVGRRVPHDVPSHWQRLTRKVSYVENHRELYHLLAVWLWSGNNLSVAWFSHVQNENNKSTYSSGIIMMIKWEYL